MKKLYSILIAILMLAVVIPASGQVKPIKRGQKQKTEQTKKQNKNKVKSSKTSKKNQNSAQEYKVNKQQERNSANDEAVRTAKERSEEGARRAANILNGGETIIVNGVSLDMVYVEGGSFSMGGTMEQGGEAYNEEKPIHRVSLTNYFIGQFEVTEALWQAVMGKTTSYTANLSLPVSVSWDDCQEFIKRLNQMTGKSFRLPTEAEWEFAARGGNKSQSYKYAGGNNVSMVAWHEGNSSRSTHTVGSKSPNELGIYDMSGNAWEWCSDIYGPYGSGTQTNPTGAYTGTKRVCRGGGVDNNARFCRVSYRIGHDSRHLSGFRLAARSL